MTTPRNVVDHIDKVPGVLMEVIFSGGRIRVQTVVNGRPRTYTIIERESQ